MARLDGVRDCLAAWPLILERGGNFDDTRSINAWKNTARN